MFGNSFKLNNEESVTERKRIPWTQKEDEKLVMLVERLGMSNWGAIAQEFENRNGKSCRSRWINKLDPNVSLKPFTKAEEEIIIRKQSELGNKWSAIAKCLYGRTDMAVKNHWNGHLKKKVLGSMSQNKNYVHDNLNYFYKGKDDKMLCDHHDNKTEFLNKNSVEISDDDFNTARQEHSDVIKKTKSAVFECLLSLMEPNTKLLPNFHHNHSSIHQQFPSFHISPFNHNSTLQHILHNGSYNIEHKKIFNDLVDSLRTIIKYFSELFDTNETEILSIFENAFKFSVKMDAQMQDIRYENVKEKQVKFDFLQHSKPISQPREDSSQMTNGMLFIEHCPAVMSLGAISSSPFHPISSGYQHFNEAIASSDNNKEHKDLEFDTNIRSIIPVVPITSDFPSLLNNKANQFQDNLNH